MNKNNYRAIAEYYVKNYGKMSVKAIAREMGCALATVYAALEKAGVPRRGKKRDIRPHSYEITGAAKSCSEVRRRRKHDNPSPVSPLTEMLVCRYYYEGDSVSGIAGELARPEETVREILNKCIENGNYLKFNLFGRDKETVRRRCLKARKIND